MYHLTDYKLKLENIFIFLCSHRNLSIYTTTTHKPKEKYSYSQKKISLEKSFLGYVKDKVKEVEGFVVCRLKLFFSLSMIVVDFSIMLNGYWLFITDTLNHTHTHSHLVTKLYLQGQRNFWESLIVR